VPLGDIELLALGLRDCGNLIRQYPNANLGGVVMSMVARDGLEAGDCYGATAWRMSTRNRAA